jgi:hypothetical protein
LSGRIPAILQQGRQWAAALPGVLRQGGLVAPNQRRLDCVIVSVREEVMLLRSTATFCFGLVLIGLAAAPAYAQSRQRVIVDGTRYVERGEDGRVRSRIVIQKRSFLDGGTEVLPGTKDLPNNALPYGYSPMGTIEGTNYGGIRHPLPGPYDLLGKNNPWPWQ